MGLKEIFDKLKGIRNESETEEIDDDVTKDRYLRSLRRERRIQMEEVEKDQLKKDIAEFKKKRDQKYMWGVKDGEYFEKKERLLEALKKKKKVEIMKQKNIMVHSTNQLNGHSGKKNVAKQTGFLGKGLL